MITIPTQTPNDFTILALENNLALEKVYRESLMEVMSIEADFIESCLEMGQIAMEALDATQVEVTKKRNIFERILDAIQALFGTFKEKITVLMDRNAQWLKANLVNITKESVSKLGEVELVPYWTRTADAISNALQDVTNTVVNRTKGSPEKFASMEELTKIVRQKIGGKDDLASDAKHFFRTGKPGVAAKPVKINGPSIAVYLEEMRSYVVEYDKLVVPKLNKYMGTIKNTVKSLQSSAKTESFCFLENASYMDTEIGLLPNFGVVLEASDNGNKDNQLSNGKINDNQKNQSMTSVTVNSDSNDKGDGNGEDKENSAKITEYCKNLSNILKTLQGAALTVLEEKYVTYINLFKVVVQKNGGSKAKEGDKDKKDDNADNSNDTTDNQDNTKNAQPKSKRRFFKGKKK